jgi:2,4-dienoyl-CoA reductase-like NADH-dependent reductase (Old Yellow Enzyme family)/NADPH-dependent 2,4-dienoyl-CoA reductase/sulfur reductase-like enzyme
MSPGRIGPLELRNRIVMPAMDQNSCSAEGLITDAVVTHYEERAAGGVGLLILETSAIAYPVGATSRHQPALSHDGVIPGFRRLADAVHAHGAAMVVQICHHGKVARVDAMDGRDQLVSSVPLPHSDTDLANITPNELDMLIRANGAKYPTQRAATVADLDEVVERFADAAARVQAAGLDGVEIHGGHGYLISSFLSPLYNHRDDDYGGSPANRARLLQRVVAAVRARCGAGFAILVRLDGQEYGHGDDGITPDLAAENAAAAAAAGADGVHVSASTVSPLGVGFTDGPLPWRHGQYVDLARTVKRRVGIPVVAVGRIEPALADRLLAEGTVCDFVSMGRQLLADPTIPARLSAGRPDLVRTCISCFVCVAQNFWDATPVCAINSRLGHYDRLPLPQPASTALKVVVVGGGPAGMEAARLAAGSGHQVVLFERDQLGGTARLSALTTPANAELVRYLVASIREAGVDVRLGTAAGVAQIRAERPDVVLVATGARRDRPDIPGGDLPHVLSGDDLRSLLSGTGRPAHLPWRHRLVLAAGRRAGLLDDVARMRRLSKRWLPLGRRVVVIGGGLVGLELSEFLAERGRHVTLLEESGYIGEEMALPRRFRAIHEAASRGVTMVRHAAVVGISEDEVSYEVDGRVQRVEADQVIYAAGVQPDSKLADELTAAGLKAQRIGDCAEVGYIQGAIHSAAAAIAAL